MRVAVLIGGLSEERNVSVASGAQVISALQAAGHEVVAVDTATGVLSPDQQQRLVTTGISPDPPNEQALARLRGDSRGVWAWTGELRRVDVIFNALHGGSGEDGTLQAVFDLAGIPYTGTGHLGSAYAMDKDIAKRLFRAAGVPTPDWRMTPCVLHETVSSLGLPLVVKPNKQGSTVGLSIVRDPQALNAAIATAAQFDDEVMLEKYVAGRELTVGILDGVALSVGEIRPKLSDIFDYASKYQQDGAEEIFPAALPDELTASVQVLALRAHKAVKAGSYSRVDFRLDEADRPWCLEVNTAPGLTPRSLLPQSAAAVSISFVELCDRICRSAVEGYRPKTR